MNLDTITDKKQKTKTKIFQIIAKKNENVFESGE